MRYEAQIEISMEGKAKGTDCDFLIDLRIPPTSSMGGLGWRQVARVYSKGR